MFNYTFEGHEGLSYKEVLSNPKQKFLFERTIKRLKQYFNGLNCEGHQKILTARFICRHHQFIFNCFNACCKDFEGKFIRPEKPYWVMPFIERTDSKINFTNLHLKEIQKYRDNPNDLLENALHESFLFHLIGVRDAFFQELNIYYDLDLSLDSVKLRNLKNKLKTKREISEEINEIEALQNDEKSWLGIALTLRNHITHRTNPYKNIVLSVGGPASTIRKYYKNPKTFEDYEEESLEFFQKCNKNMKALIYRLRESAIWKNISLD